MSINPIYPRETTDIEYYCERCDKTMTELEDVPGCEFLLVCPVCGRFVDEVEFDDEPDECRVPF